jgi:sugar/nucleoside kinase (ribokinase family)
VSAPKAARAAPLLRAVAFISPNAVELLALAHAVRQRAQGCDGTAAEGTQPHAGAPLPPLPPLPSPGAPPPAYADAPAALAALRGAVETVLLAGCGCVVTTLGAQGALLSTRTRGGGDGIAIMHTHLPAAPVARVESTAGAGDAVVAGALHALAAGADARAALAAGLAAAAVVVQRPDNAPPASAWPPPAALRAAADGILAQAHALH